MLLLPGGGPRGPPHGGTNSSQGWESGVNTSSLTDGPLHYINTQHTDRESPGRNKAREGWNREQKSSINSTEVDFIHPNRQNILFQEATVKNDEKQPRWIVFQWVVSGMPVFCGAQAWEQPPAESLSWGERHEFLRASFHSGIHGGERVIMWTLQPWNSSNKAPAPCSHLCVSHILLSVLTDRETELLTTVKTSDAEPIRRKLPKGKKQRRKKKYGRVTPDQREALLWPTQTRVFEVLIKIHTE